MYANPSRQKGSHLPAYAVRRKMGAKHRLLSKEGLDRITAVTGETADTMRDCCSKAVKGAQEYHNRVLEFAQTNANSSFELTQRLLNSKSPSEFFAVSSDHMQRQWKMIADQTKQLAELAQNATAASAEPLKSGFEKIFKRAA